MGGDPSWALLMFQGPRRGIPWALPPALLQLQQRADRGEKRRGTLDWVHLVSWNNSGEGDWHDWGGLDFGQLSTPKIWVIVVCL